MRIDWNSNVGATEASSQKTGSGRSASASQSTQQPTEFSPKQAKLSSLAASALTAPEVRLEKVQALRAQVQQGTYRVAPAQTANSLLELAHRAR